MNILRHTRSVCPVCLSAIPAVLYEKEKKIYMKKECAEHGSFETLIWHGLLDFEEWRSGTVELADREGINCPSKCGICEEHLQGTCCVLLEVTRRCNLNCKFCFAHENIPEPTLDDLKKSVDFIYSGANRPTIQLSGGEPTLRDDLPELIRYIRDKGAKYVQLNSNGLRLASDESYVQSLKDAGLSYVFLQFDGTDDEIYKKLRGVPLMEEKFKAIENCGRYGIGVTLVPTIVRGINEDKIGDIVRYASFLSPIVRGVHFQPVSYFGHFPNKPTEYDRYTLDELIFSISKDLNIDLNNIVPSHCDHPGCGFHASFYVDEFGDLSPLSNRKNLKCMKTDAEQNREFIGRHWSAPSPVSEEEKTELKNSDEKSLTYLADRLGRYSFTLTAMAFQDAGNLDIERLMRCSLHVYNNGKLKPFCANYLTPFLPYGCGMSKLSPCANEQIEELLMQKAGLTKSSILLDVGCGRGDRASYLSNVVAEIVGIDEDYINIAFANRTCNENLRFISGNAETLPFPSNSFDILLCECTLSLSNDPKKALNEFYRVLKPGGFLLISDIYFKSDTAEQHTFDDNAVAKNIYSDKSLSEMFKENDFGEVYFEDFTHELRTMFAEMLFNDSPDSCVDIKTFKKLNEHKILYGLWIRRKLYE